LYNNIRVNKHSNETTGNNTAAAAAAAGGCEMGRKEVRARNI
jgi:hypothetical protein